MERIPLRPGTSTPDFVAKVLDVLGNNPHGEPNFRLIWSERKMILFLSEETPEYFYLEPQCWVLETWLDPEKAAGPEYLWSEMQERLMGPYPREGVYFYSQHFPSDWYPSESSMTAIAKGVMASRHVEMAARKEAIRKNLEDKATAARQKVADEIVELQDSASLGIVQQSVSGPKNTFRTADDFGRDLERSGPANANLPRHGGKLIS